HARPGPMRRLLLLLAGLLAPLRAYEPDWGKLQGLARGKVEVTAGGAGNHPLLWAGERDGPGHNLVMKHLPGADPELVLLSFRYEELERIPLSDMSREEINQLVQELGFYRKEAPDAPVPEEFQLAPARPLPTLQAKEQSPGAPSPPAPTAKSKPPRKPGNQEHPDL
uniref:Selenoprotein M n=1 Tax=Chrysemys picta bellii TaxID=8478 RepID=A0A8C3FIK5_CHRPI